MSDQFVLQEGAPFVINGMAIGFLQRTEDHGWSVVRPDGQVIMAADRFNRPANPEAYEYHDPRAETVAEVAARMDRAEQIERYLNAPEYEPEPEPEESYSEQEMAFLEWMDRFGHDLDEYQRENGRDPTDREVHDLATQHFAQWQRGEEPNIYTASLDIHEPDLSKHQGRVDYGTELAADIDRAQRGVSYDPRGERAATEYPDTNEGRTNLALDMRNGFVDKHGQSIDAEPEPAELT